jgi:glycosyltransferase involved in cell wall biosynthesis
MPKLLYLTNARIPSLMANGLQIAQNCEAFADHGLDVTLWCANRRVPPAERALGDDLWAHYGVKRNFRFRRLPTLDLTHLIEGRQGRFINRLATVLFLLQFGTFALAALIAALSTHADIYYSRDPLTLLLLGLVKPRTALIYESHRLNRSRLGKWMLRQVLRRCALTAAVTPPLRERLEALQTASPVKSHIIVAHDGIREARFRPLFTQAEARRAVGWTQEAFIVGYVGRLRTLGMEKGLDTLIDAIALIPDGSISLAIVGGPESYAEAYRARWLALGLPDSRFLYAGQIRAERVPIYLSAFDVCAMPYPHTEFFANDVSPIKLFEYMASGRALVASALPSYADVVQDGENALLVPPSDAHALAAAIMRLRDDAPLRARLGETAKQQVFSSYTWAARTRRIIEAHRRA